MSYRHFATLCNVHSLIVITGEISELARTSTATVAGAISGVVTAPAELLMIQQQKWGGSLGDRLRVIVNEHGALSLAKGMVSLIVCQNENYRRHFTGVELSRSGQSTFLPAVMHNRISVLSACARIPSQGLCRR